MAIKKPITKTPPKKITPASDKKLKKRSREEEEEEVEETEEEDPSEEEEEEEETPAPKKKKKAAPVEEEEEEEADEEEEEEAPRRTGSKKKKKKKSSKSFADIFDSTKPGRGLLPVGDYKALVAGFEIEGEIAEEGDDQGELKVKVTYEIHEDEDEGVAGKNISQWYQICSEDGEAGPGIPFLKGDLDVLCYEDVLLEDLQQICEDIEAERPEVLIKVKQNGQYTNAYLQGLAEEE